MAKVKIMRDNEIISSGIQCYIDLSLFNALTGETSAKEFQPKEVQKELTACEEINIKKYTVLDSAGGTIEADELVEEFNDFIMDKRGDNGYDAER